MGLNSKEIKVISTAKGKTNPFKDDVILDPMGQWKYPGQVTKIPDRNITMKGVPYPVLGVDNLGNEQMMYPGMDYTFPGESVTEYPQLDDLRRGGKKKKKKKPYSDAERSRVSELRGPVSNPTWTNPNYQGGGWLDKYQKAGTTVDPRKIPQSGVVVDKRTNQAYYFGDKGETGSFPVLTGQSPDFNSNARGIGYLEEHPEARNTPTGYYRMAKQYETSDPDFKNHYKNMFRQMMPIPAYGVPTPEALDLGFHRTYNEPSNPNVFKNREKKYECGPGQRWGSYGCINAQEESYQAVNKAFPNADTLMVIDSQKTADLALLKQAQGRMVSPTPEYDYTNKMIPLTADKEQYSPKTTTPVTPVKKTPARRDTTINTNSFKDMSDEEFFALKRHVKDTYPPKNIKWIKEDGGEAEEDIFRRGGMRRSPKRTTPKNIQTSLNFLTRRNEMLFGPAGPRMYDLDKKPGSKWLDKYK